tara:strand:- start:2748 stop:2933 length:186 start_codon:yes stop_codon:yes gene_type:complete
MSKELEKLKKQRDEFWRNTEIDEIFGIPQDYIENSITYRTMCDQVESYEEIELMRENSRRK